MTSLAIQPGSFGSGAPRGAPGVRDQDRLGLTLFVALAVHALIILGISFKAADDIADPVLNMEITLVHQHAKEAPEDAEYLAQANQLGGGDVQEKVRATSPFSNPQPTLEEGFAPDSRAAIAPPPTDTQQQQTELLTARQAQRQVASKTQQDPLPEQPTTLTAAQLFERSREIARLTAEINRIKQTYQQTPRHTHVNGANARQYRFAAYMEAWRVKVEQIGNVNYPEQAVRKNLSGSLLLDVAINTDGSLRYVRVLRPSGHKVLDDAAVRIVKLAAPYPALPEEIRRDTDILHIPRVWRFQSGSGLRTSAQ